MNIQTNYGIRRVDSIPAKTGLMDTFGMRLRRTREKRGFNQDELASELTKYIVTHPELELKTKRVTQQQYSDWETEAVGIKPKMLKAIAAVLTVTVDYLLLLVDEENSRLEEADLDDHERLFVRRLRQNPQLKQLAYQLFRIDDSGPYEFLSPPDNSKQ